MRHNAHNDNMNNKYYYKYMKYKLKLLRLINKETSQKSLELIDNKLHLMIGGNEDKKLFSINNLDDLFDDKYRFYKIYRQDPKKINVIMNYIFSNFKSFNNLQKIKKHNFHKMFAEKISDADIYRFLRNQYSTNVESIIKSEDNLYVNHHIISKVKYIKQNIDLYVPNFNCKKILDIGTENIGFLNQLEKIMKCPTFGINIDTGFSHYSGYTEGIKSGKIILYDGVNFPFDDNEFSLVTILAVLHHVEKFNQFLDGVCRITQNIYIKDNDISDTLTGYQVEIQHELYEGVLFPGEKTPLYHITLKGITDRLIKNNFKIVHQSVYPGFTRGCTIIASKNLA